MASVARLKRSLGIPNWQPGLVSTAAEIKASLRRYRREIVTPAVVAAAGVPENPPLPWLWIASMIPSNYRPVFEAWWQLRILAQLHPPRNCPWCEGVPATVDHLTLECSRWSEVCFYNQVVPAEVFQFPRDSTNFQAKLQAVSVLLRNMDADGATATGEQGTEGA